MRAIIDFDILRYEVGYGAETGWNNEGEIPPWDYVEDMLLQRIQYILYEAGANLFTGYLSEGKCFRYDIAKRKPYKATRVHKRPWHYNNLTVYMRDILDCKIISVLEADDAMVMAHLEPEETILCSRDKDLRQCPGLFYSWELWRQPSYGPLLITKEGTIALSEDKKKIVGNGLAFFYAQLLWGDVADDIPGLPGCGPVRTYELLGDCDPDNMLTEVKLEYQDSYADDWKEELLEQGQLLWLCRRFNPDGSPELWSIGMEE